VLNVLLTQDYGIIFPQGVRGGNTMPNARTDYFRLSHQMVYPNPVSADLIISLNSISADALSIYNNLGEKIVIQPVIGNKQTVLTNNLSNGIYYLKVMSGDFVLGYKKISVSH
jgi:hypothetical protein